MWISNTNWRVIIILLLHVTNSSHASGPNTLLLTKMQLLKDVLSLASLALEMVDPIPSKPMVLYLFLEAALGCQSVQAMIGEHCKERTQRHSNSIAFYSLLIRCLYFEGNARVDAGQELKPKICIYCN